MKRVTDPKDFGRVAVVMGGESAERDVSLDGGRAVLAGLRAAGVEADAVDGTRALIADIQAERFERVFIMLHGRGGEDGAVQGALQTLGVPYTGSGVLGSALTLDKVRTKRVWQALELPVPDGVVVWDAEPPGEVKARVQSLSLPLIVKPVREGSTIGMSRVETLDALEAALELARRHDPYVLIERFIDGPEYTAAILHGEPLPLICIEAKGRWYDYQAKYHSEETRYLIPAGLEAEVEHKMQAMCLAAFEAAGCAGWGRVDFMLDNEARPWLLEVNTVPGMTGHSLVPMAAKAAGLDFEALCWRILETSLEVRE